MLFLSLNVQYVFRVAKFKRIIQKIIKQTHEEEYQRMIRMKKSNNMSLRKEIKQGIIMNWNMIMIQTERFDEIKQIMSIRTLFRKTKMKDIQEQVWTKKLMRKFKNYHKTKEFIRRRINQTKILNTKWNTQPKENKFQFFRFKVNQDLIVGKQQIYQIQ
ncbi:unnamed protein product [Paramecium sonneborni]|uniref:Uncharacterized protein n=1 Tax=Paramecium sonneborni TaxID=65129 RepID=A0A8S1M1M1_9CILI|nr:unnamed protein product [Paramecium sonneborni]